MKIIVYARQFANFTATPTLISQGDTVQFTDTSEAGPVKWYWDFGDGENSTLQNPAHTYRKHGNFTVTLTAWNDLGSDTITREDYIQMYSTAAPVAKFTSNFTYDHYYPPLAVAFTDASTGMNLSWYWDFDDGTNTTVQDPVHVYSTIPDDRWFMEYRVNQTVIDELGRKSHSSDSIDVRRNMTPDFIAEPRLASGNRTITFTDLTPRGNWSYGYYNRSYYQSWSFGDGSGTEWFPGIQPDYEEPPVSVTHEYMQPGNYTVSLSTDIICGCECQVTTTKEDYIIITDSAIIPLVTDFSANTTSGTRPLAVAFTDSASGSPSGWNWSFGDGAVSGEQNPVHVYSGPGTYTVTLTATNIFGSNTSTKPGYITVTSQNTPVAGFAANTTQGYSPLTVGFTDESLHHPVEWSWDFGDGRESTEQNPAHTYTAPGNYSVSLVVGNDKGSNSTMKTDYIHVLVELPGIIPDPEGFPVVNFTANVTTGNAPLAVGFTDRTRNASTFWNWSFGDGGTSAEQNPVHTYSLPGTYTVSLAAGNEYGENSSVKADFITVTAGTFPPAAAFTGTPTCGKAPLSVTFTDSSAGSPSAWSWDFGDGATSPEQHPVHTYTAAGKYTVSLTASNAGGSNTSTRLDYITVSGSCKPPVAKFSGKPTSGYAPLMVSFSDSSTNNPAGWLWDFGDNTNSTEQNPAHTYTSPGKYTVSLTATNTG
ncbi:MAG: PKD domain-containing protein, partial [Methanoregula sp.]